MRPGVGYSAVSRGLRTSRYQLGSLTSPYREWPLDESSNTETGGPGFAAAWEKRYGPGTMNSLGPDLAFKRWAGPGNEVKFMVSDALAWLYRTNRVALGGDTSNRDGLPTSQEVTDAQATGDTIWRDYMIAVLPGYREDNPLHFSDTSRPHGLQLDEHGNPPIDPFWNLPIYRFNDATQATPPVQPPPEPPPVTPPPVVPPVTPPPAPAKLVLSADARETLRLMVQWEGTTIKAGKQARLVRLKNEIEAQL
jgi:hypothetical protein